MPGFAIAVVSDLLMFQGAHVALLSTLIHWKGSHPPHFVFFHEGLSASATASLYSTLDKSGLPYQLQVREISSQAFGNHPALHGSRMNYCRLMLPELLPGTDRVLYIDADVLVLTDLSVFQSMDLGGHPFGAVAETTFRWVIDQSLAVKRNIALDTPYFNNGVMLFDLDAWRRQDLLNECLEFMRTYSLELVSHEQTALNHLFIGRYLPLPLQYNRSVPPYLPPLTDPDDCLIHFWGSPKPFDFLGSVLHKNFALYSPYLQRICYQPSLRHRYFQPEALRRIARLSRSYVIYGARILRERILPGKPPQS